MYKGLKVSVVMPAYNEAPGIVDAVRGYLAFPEVDEVVVADNNSSDGTAALARKAGAVVFPESRQGYGYACRTAIQSAAGDLIVLVESDSTFRPTDIFKFFAYAEDFDIVFGTRTSKSCIWAGSTWARFFDMETGRWLSYLNTSTTAPASPTSGVPTSYFAGKRCNRSRHSLPWAEAISHRNSW